MWTQTMWMVGEWASLVCLAYGAWLAISGAIGNVIGSQGSADLADRLATA